MKSKSYSLLQVKMMNIMLAAAMVLSLCTACSSSEETTKTDKGNEPYIFDEIPPEDTYVFETPVSSSKEYYLVQIGAFSTKERAELFAAESKRILGFNLKVDYNSNVGLYVVQLEEIFNSREAAAAVRDKLWQYEKFNDAWVVTKKKEEQR